MQNNITAPANRVNIVQMVVKGESFTTFKDTIMVQQGEGNLTNKIVDQAMDVVAEATFPHCALFQQKALKTMG